MKLDDIDPLLSRASDHLAMAIRLRDTAAKLHTAPGRQKLVQLAALYEELSLHFLEESRAASANRRRQRLDHIFEDDEIVGGLREEPETRLLANHRH
jgi:hypothetical protein